MPNNIDPQKPMALVSVPYGDILLSADDACAVFKILCKAAIVEYDWNSKTYKLKDTKNDGAAKLRTFSFEDYAALALNSSD